MWSGGFSLESRVQDLGLESRVQVLRFRVSSAGLRFQGLEISVPGLCFWVWISAVGVLSSGFGV